MTEEVKEGWKKVRFSDLVIINPKISLEKGKEYPFIEMEDLSPGNRYVSSTKKRVFKGGGSKFMMGDVLFARITPSLENGKIAQVKHTAIKGFGSTEFFVFRYREGISDSSFIYYLSFSDIIRKPAEKSMFGASGRQRADLNVVQDLEMGVPPVRTQRKIAAILSAYDDLIENNTRGIKILEEMVQTIYREWFVKFRFSGYEKVKMVYSELGHIPEGWEVKRLGDVVELAYGKALKKDDRRNGSFPVYGSSGVVGHHNEYLVQGPGSIVGRKGNVGSVFWSQKSFYPIDTVFFVKTNVSLYYAYSNLKEQNFVNTDAAVPGLSRNQAYLNKFLLPSNDILHPFEEFIFPIFTQIEKLQSQIENLCRTRDLLLPKLISGEIDVAEIDLNVKNIVVES
ncbi:MAG: restriction endonuclease subunit S [Methanophagales archaeon]|nr:restriction endonuclease subunit S [Methanophagales archaeon]